MYFTVVGFGIGGWASIKSFVDSIHKLGALSRLHAGKLPMLCCHLLVQHAGNLGRGPLRLFSDMLSFPACRGVCSLLPMPDQARKWLMTRPRRMSTDGRQAATALSEYGWYPVVRHLWGQLQRGSSAGLCSSWHFLGALLKRVFYLVYSDQQLHSAARCKSTQNPSAGVMDQYCADMTTAAAHL